MSSPSGRVAVRIVCGDHDRHAALVRIEEGHAILRPVQRADRRVRATPPVSVSVEGGTAVGGRHGVLLSRRPMDLDVEVPPVVTLFLPQGAHDFIVTGAELGQAVAEFRASGPQAVKIIAHRSS